MNANAPLRLQFDIRRVLLAWVAAACLSGSPLIASAGEQPCRAGWTPREGILGADHDVLAMARWDPDGNGPLREQLIAGGWFQQIGPITASGIATWDGSRWNGLGDGVPNALSILPLEGELYVSTQTWNPSTQSSTGGVTRWDGTSWTALAGTFAGPPEAGVFSLARYDGAIYAGGRFTEVDGVPLANIARWDGSAWQPLGGGVDGAVRALRVYDGELVAAGEFYKADGLQAGMIARWNGAAWANVGGGLLENPQSIYLGGGVYALAEFQGDLYAAGGFFRNNGGAIANGIARFDGDAWHPLWTNPYDGVDGRILALGVVGDALIVGGEFTSLSGIAQSARVARWDGQAWSRVGSVQEEWVNAVAEFDGRLVVGGYFGHGRLWNIAEWRDPDWAPLGPGLDGEPLAMLPFRDRLVAGGSIWLADGELVRGVAQWDGVAWGGFDGSLVGQFRALAEFGGNLVVGGSFHRLGEPSTGRNIARWNGTSFERMGDGLPGVVRAMTVFNGSLFAGGNIYTTGSLPLRGLARWDGATWQNVDPTRHFDLQAMAVYRDELIVAGSIRNFADDHIDRILRWDGQTWRPLAGGVIGEIASLAVYGGELFVGGDLSEVDGQPASGLARWNGSSWTTLESPDELLGIYAVRHMNLHRGRLVVGGSIHHPDESWLPISRIATWNGASWSLIGEAKWGETLSSASFRGDLYIGGLFREVNDEYFNYWARFRECGASTILGDLNCDGAVSAGDISGFVTALLDQQSYYNTFVNCNADLADANADGFITVADIGPFVSLLTNQ